MADGDLLSEVVPSDDQHLSFKILISESRFEAAREKLREVWAAFPNPDDHFVREFQTAGFDARVWELVLFAGGYFGPFTVSKPHESPDFYFERNGTGAWIEATTANPSAKIPREIEADGGDEEEVLFHQMNNVLPIRLGSPLYSKLKRKYWELPHVAGNAFVIAIEDVSDPDPARMTDAPLFRYLYGMEHRVVSLPGDPVRIEQVKLAEHRHGAKVIPSGFFDLPGAENVSAVIFSNDGTIPKFNRMGFDLDRHRSVRLTRVGTCMNFDPTATLPATFGYLVGDFPEEWGHGMSVYHNPRAIHPVVSQNWIDEALT
jgi:hypothetical protein